MNKLHKFLNIFLTLLIGYTIGGILTTNAIYNSLDDICEDEIIQEAQVESLRYDFIYEGDYAFVEVEYQGDLVLRLNGCVEICESQEINQVLPDDFTIEEYWNIVLHWYDLFGIIDLDE